MTGTIWTLEESDHLPIIATALHAGHAVRDEVLRHMVIGEADRLREEDPFTDRWTVAAPTRIVGLRSRFEVDLNRSRERAVYRTLDQSWGMQVWDGGLPDDVAERSLAQLDAFYDMLRDLFRRFTERHGRFVVFDLHSYCHRRGGPGALPDDPAQNPDVIVGTRMMPDRARWAPVIDAFIETVRGFDFTGRRLDVRENVKFWGAQFARFAHTEFPESACHLCIEFKKTFMDEWTGEPDETRIALIGELVQRAAEACVGALSG